jgi:hypothetical protein
MCSLLWVLPRSGFHDSTLKLSCLMLSHKLRSGLHISRYQQCLINSVLNNSKGIFLPKNGVKPPRSVVTPYFTCQILTYEEIISAQRKPSKGNLLNIFYNCSFRAWFWWIIVNQFIQLNAHDYSHISIAYIAPTCFGVQWHHHRSLPDVEPQENGLFTDK